MFRYVMMMMRNWIDKLIIYNEDGRALEGVKVQDCFKQLGVVVVAVRCCRR